MHYPNQSCSRAIIFVEGANGILNDTPMSSSTPCADLYAPAAIVPIGVPGYRVVKEPSKSTWHIWLHQNDGSKQRESGWRMIGRELHGIIFSACSRSGRRWTFLRSYRNEK
ncbi:hypothetical protein TRIATDRAFT_278417 [Trichoderma atroviride IMI 206040]|uniref:Uncharacterized protein n=1 Tax=Hypocrea atroviridis (strain ATCC 20476 / IMI 206040) TaxID=452589 RepID=G9P5F8_HYPAI|nr:uncharacterized protein TRIATDRAFT_278417 [Trichoderma atroviride IMI 206040]EHK42129.1 hypothetical protein TRIATDRAFT_278417 [Trichoderma atroviride IMI 206040]